MLYMEMCINVQYINNKGLKRWLPFSLQIRGSRSRALHDRAIINCQYSMATFSTAERKRRPHGDRKSTEMSLHLKQTFEAAVMTQLYPRSQIDIYVKVSNREGLIQYSLCLFRFFDLIGLN